MRKTKSTSDAEMSGADIHTCPKTTWKELLKARVLIPSVISGVVSGLIVSLVCYFIAMILSTYEITLHTCNDTNLNPQKVNPLAFRTVTLLTPDSKPGYRFVGWYKNATYEGDSIKEIPPRIGWHIEELYAKWDEITYKITFNYNAERMGDSICNYNVKDIPSVPSPTRDGYTFEGWYDTPDSWDELFSIESLQRNPRNITVYAKWKEIKVVVPPPEPRTVTVTNEGYGSKERAERFATAEAESLFQKRYPGVKYYIDKPTFTQDGINWGAKITACEILTK